MKKISSLVAVFALTAVGLFTASCSDNDNPTPTPKVVEDVTVDQINVLEVTSNVTATFTFGNRTLTGKSVKFETNQMGGTLAVKADGYIEETHEVTFSSDKTYFKIEAQLVKPSTIQVSQAEARGSVVTNDVDNTATMGVAAALAVPADVVITGNTVDPFSVVAYKPESDLEPEISANQSITKSVAGLLCSPDGAKFDKPVTVTMTIPEAAGCEFEDAEGNLAEVEGDKVSIKVSHFSPVPLFLRARVISAIPGVELNRYNVRISKGINRLSADQRTGFTSSDASGVKESFLESTHGALGEITRSAQFEVDADGSAVIEERQEYTDITYRSGTQTFSARVYGAFDATVISTSADTTPVHGGGSN